MLIFRCLALKQFDASKRKINSALGEDTREKIMQKTTLINDSQNLIGATSRFGSAIKTYDDGYGDLFIHRDSMGISGIVRARTWEDAYSICEDEFFPACDLTLDEIKKEYDFIREHVKIVRGQDGIERDCQMSDYSDNGKLPDGMFIRWETRETPCEDAWSENELFCESYGFRPNGLSDVKNPMSFIYAKDLNGDSLELLTHELLTALEITLQIEDQE